jgi:integrase
MSVYKPKNSPYYQFDFQLGGHRFHGTTGRTNRRDAEGVEREEKEKARTAIKAAKAATGGPLTIDAAADRYWLEVGSLHANSKTTWTDLGRLVDYFGPTKLLAEIGDEDVARLVQWRRAHKRNNRDVGKDGEPVGFVSAATVNRSTTEVLKKLFTRAKRTWKHTFPAEPTWRDHMLREPIERVRELKREEGAALTLATRADYEPILKFARVTGLRMDECLLTWSEVDWDAGLIKTIGKGGKLVTAGITPAVRDILEPLIGHHPTAVFTYVAVRTRAGRVKGRRYPITYSGLQSQWKRLRAKAGVTNFRFHDIRHDVGTKLLRQTGNLKLVQRALNHSDIKTTTRYAHVLDAEVSAAMQTLATTQARDGKSRTKSRSRLAKHE